MQRTWMPFSLTKTILLFFVLAGYTSGSYASDGEVLGGINFENPALLSFTKTGELMIGVDVLNPQLKFTGTSFGVSGTARSNETDALPYGRIACRLTKKVVVAFAVTQPTYVDINWGANSLVRFSSIETLARQWAFSPKVCVQVTDKLAFGLGVAVAYYYDSRIDFATPTTGRVKNHASGVNANFDVGLLYTLNAQTFVSLYCFAPRKIKTTGESTSDTGLSNPNYNLELNDRAVVHLRVMRIFTPKLLAYAGVYYTNWSRHSTFDYNNTVLGNLVSQLSWRDTYSFELVSKYDIHKNISILLAGMYETNFANPRFNTVAYPGSDTLLLAGGFIYHLSQFCDAQLTYGHLFYVPDARINNATEVGKAKVNANAFGGRLTYHW